MERERAGARHRVLPSSPYDEEYRCHCRLRGPHEVNIPVRPHNPHCSPLKADLAQDVSRTSMINRRQT